MTARDRFAEYMKTRYNSSFSAYPLSADQALCRIKGKQSEHFRIADGLDWESDRTGTEMCAEFETEDGYRVEFSARYDDWAEIDWDIDPEPIADIAAYYHGSVSKSVALEMARHLHQKQSDHAARLRNGDYSAMIFGATVYDPEGNEIGEDSIGGCYVEWIGDDDTAYCLSDYTVPESFGYIDTDREARKFVESSMAT